MQVIKGRAKKPFFGGAQSALLGILLCGLFGGIAAFILRDFLLHVLVILVGLPLVLLLFSSHFRPTMIVITLATVPLVGILKAISGSRFAPLTFDLGLLMACLFVILHEVLRKRVHFSLLDFLWLSFFVLAFMQMFNPNVPSLQAGIEGFRKFAFMSIAFYLGRHLLSLKDLKFFRRLILAISVVVALYGLKQFFYLSTLDLKIVELATAGRTTYFMGGWIRPFSTTPGPFHLGLYMMIVLLLACTLLVDKKTTTQYRIVLIGIIVLELTVLIMTRTKGNWIGLIVGVLVLAFLQGRHSLRAMIRLLGFSLLGVLTIALLITFTSDAALRVMQDAIFAVTRPLEAPTFIYRLGLWNEIMIPAFQAHPIIGYGTSSAGEGLSNLYRETSSMFFSSHNLYLKIALELGIPGLFLFLSIVVGSVMNGWRNIKRLSITSSDNERIIFYWAFTVLSAFLVAGLVIPTLDAYPPNYYFWLLLGILSVNWAKRERA